MDDARLEELIAVVPPLLACLEALGLVARHPEAADAAAILQAVTPRYLQLRSTAPAVASWRGDLLAVGSVLADAASVTLTAMNDAFAAAESDAGALAMYRALRLTPLALEALWPLAADVPPIGRFFLDPHVRQDPAVAARLAAATGSLDAGLFHIRDGAGERGGYTVFAPDDYDKTRAWPLIVALHGGGGAGRRFIWSLLREARSHGALVLAPTSLGETWSLHEPEPDAANLSRTLEEMRGRWRVDPGRLLLTGMSDGGTFSYLAALAEGAPYSRFAPVAAAWHPLLLAMSDPERVVRTSIRIVHGAGDWMFPVATAHEAAQALAAAGADVDLRIIEDLGHAWPREIVPDLIRWLDL